MDFSKLLDPIAGYLNSLIDFLSFKGFSDFTLLGEINTTAMSLFFVGLIFAFIILRTGNLSIFDPGFGPRPETVSELPDQKKVDTSSLLVFIPLCAAASILFEVSVWIYGLFSDTKFGNLKDTINAMLICGGMQYPIQAISSRVNSLARLLGPLGGKARIFGAVLQMTMGLVLLWLVVHFVWLLSVIHNVHWGYVIIPFLINMVLFLFLLFPLGQAILWVREASDKKPQAGKG